MNIVVQIQLKCKGAEGWLIIEPFKGLFTPTQAFTLVEQNYYYYWSVLKYVLFSNPLKQPVGKFEVKLGFLNSIKECPTPATYKVIV